MEKDKEQKQEEPEATPESTYCVFKVGEKDFLLPVETVREVIDASPMFSVPLSPDYVYGVVPLRGRVIPAIDLSKVYTTGKPSYDRLKLVIVDVEVELLREVINESIGFISDGLPYFVTFSSDIPSDDILDTKNFFKTFRIKES